MGLHNTAHFLKSKGRNDDTELVHMTKGEVEALKGLAAKHGGSLTTNPETGLPEAGFLSSVLPMVAGIGLDILTDGAITPLLSGMLVGGADYAMTGSITKGLMAGLGAYGGAGLSDALGDMGAQAFDQAATSNLQTLNPNVDPSEFGREMGTPGFNMPTTPPVPPSAGANVLSGLGQATSSLSSAGSFLADNSGSALMAAAPILSDVLGKKPTLPGASTSAQQNPFGMKTIPTDANGKPMFNATLPAQPNPHYVAKYPNYVQNPYNPYATTPTPTSTVYAAGGGLMDPNSEPVDFMGGDMYPQSQQSSSAYATPSQMPTSAQQTLASYEPKTNPLTGEATVGMASGGIASYSGKFGSVVQMNDAVQSVQDLYGQHTPMSTPTPDVGIYQDTDPNTRNLDAYDRALYIANAKAKTAGMKKGTIALPKASVKLGDIEEDAAGGVVGMAAGGNVPTYHRPVSGAGAGGDFTPTGGWMSNALVGLNSMPQSDINTFRAASGLPAQAPSMDGHIYKPGYANYAQTPFTMASAPAYGGIPIPTRSAMSSGTTPGIAGYAIDPKGMIGSPAYQQLQQQLADAQAAAAAAQQSSPQSTGWDGSGGGKSGGVMPNDLAYAGGGFVPSLGGYAAGGNPRLLKGPGDGMSDSIPANIGGKQPARLADGEFVVPADVVSHLGNGSTDAGAKKLYSMMDNIRKARTGRKKQAPAVNPEKYLPK